MPDLWPAIAVSVFVAIHVSGYRLRWLAHAPRSIWLSLAGGSSVAYVFLHLLPELAQGQRALEGAMPGELVSGLEKHIYLLALAGLTLFYGLERLASGSRLKTQEGAQATGTGVFALHIASFASYNFLIGYLLVHGERSDLFFYATAMGLHFLVNDNALREHHKARYDRLGRWLLAAAVLAGWALGNQLEIAEVWVQVLIALLAGGIILNVMKEELPSERASRFWAFFLGAAAYGALILLA